MTTPATYASEREALYRALDALLALRSYDHNVFIEVVLSHLSRVAPRGDGQDVMGAVRQLHDIIDACRPKCGGSLAICSEMARKALDCLRVKDPEPAKPAEAGSEVVHELKIWPEFFDAIMDGRKTFEWRKNDRSFGVGDVLWLREYNPDGGAYTGREARRTVTYWTQGPDFGIPEGYCILALAPAKTSEPRAVEVTDKQIADAAEAWVRETAKEPGQQSGMVWSKLLDLVWKRQEQRKAQGEGR